MAHNNRTPETVLNAPKLNPVFVYPTLGPNRAERRHLKITGEKNVPATRTLTKEQKILQRRQERRRLAGTTA